MDAKKIFTPPFQYSTTPSEYLLSKEGWSSMAVVSKSDHQISKAKKSFPGKVNESFGFLGFFHLQHASYLCSIKEAKYIGSLLENNIFQVSDVDFLPLTSIKDQEALTSLRFFINSSYFYFSYTLNLTNAVSRIGQYRDPMTLESSDARFCWNLEHSEAFNKFKVQELIVPVISGFVQVEHVSLEGQTVDFGVISRRDCRRAGTRYHTRGLDNAGNAANFVETEQILAWNDSGRQVLSSFLQIRGSIPLIWTQSPNLSWNPKVVISPQKEPGLKHNQETLKIYKNLVYVNLIDKKGTQKRLGEAFSSLVNSTHQKIIWFDFHKECKNMKYENLSKLLEELNEYLEDFSWTEVELEKNHQIQDGIQKKVQNGVFRTNCVDCLDRTGVVQSVFARAVLHKLLGAGHRASDPMGAFPASLEYCFRNFWANNTDAISLMYSGTKAMKTDYTRTGKRTTAGALQDSKYGLTRYFINNFYDGSRQNNSELFLGRLHGFIKSESRLKVFTFIVLLMIVVISSFTLAGKITTGLLQTVLFFLIILVFYKTLLPLIGGRLIEKPLKLS
jgi:hypothetical protein